MDFHAILAVPKAEKHPHPRFAQLPEIETFAKSEKEKKLLSMWRGFRNGHVAFRVTAWNAQRPGGDFARCDAQGI